MCVGLARRAAWTARTPSPPDHPLLGALHETRCHRPVAGAKIPSRGDCPLDCHSCAPRHLMHLYRPLRPLGLRQQQWEAPALAPPPQQLLQQAAHPCAPPQPPLCPPREGVQHPGREEGRPPHRRRGLGRNRPRSPGHRRHPAGRQCRPVCRRRHRHPRHICLHQLCPPHRPQTPRLNHRSVSRPPPCRLAPSPVVAPRALPPSPHRRFASLVAQLADLLCPAPRDRSHCAPDRRHGLPEA
mmetsp:Transcript_27561/g.88613  ORF Transcript_27561/g.88613 Transcript_27561/m.88613 type:complete len:241 (+) Transcript_27561:1333-2055(+)